MSQQATLLGLPTELRLRIYEYICHADIDGTILSDIQHTSDAKHGTQARLIPNDHLKLNEHIPWLSLASTSSTVCSELRSYMASTSFLDDTRNRTYVMDIDVYARDGEKAVRQALWRRLPCQPDDAQTLIINVAAKVGNGPWSEGGPASLARAIYQILNHMCHNGPLLVRQKPLPSHMRLRDLLINVDIGGFVKPPRSGCNTDPRFNYGLLHSGFEQISKMGYLFGYVANIKVCGGSDFDWTSYMVDSLGVSSVPGAWQNYGFSWGVR